MIKNAETIKQTDLLPIVKKYVELKRAGREYTGCCPFHAEKTPSFRVNEEKNSFFCHGCGKGGGGAVSFVMELNNLTYPEALEKVAQLSGIRVEYDTNVNMTEWKAATAQKNERYSVLSLINKSLANEFKTQLSSSIYPTAKIGEREYKYETLHDFSIGYLSNDEILNLRKEKSWNDDDLLEIGLLKEGQNGKYAGFRERYMFPIEDHTGRVVGFGGRKPYHDENKKNPKYINSPESVLYDKSRVLYGLRQNARTIKDKNYAILVEGYTDVITPYDFGVKNVVATCGTALSAFQAKLLFRYCDEVIICRDNDAAGRKAAKRDTEVLLRQGFSVKVLTLPIGQDPDSFTRNKAKRAFDIYAQSEAEDAIVKYTMQGYKHDDLIRKQNCYETAGYLLGLLKSDAQREMYLRELTQKKYLGGVKKILQEQIREQSEVEEKGSDLTKEQETDVMRYGVFEESNQYWIGYQKDIATSITNFVINPIMLVVGSEVSTRVIEVTNEHGHFFYREVNSDDMVEIGPMKKVLARKGNYLFRSHAKPEHYARIIAKVYDNTPEVFPITTMGWHQAGNFFTWGNGICVNGNFLPVDEYGRVTHDQTNYYLPAWSKIRDGNKADDDQNGLEDQRKHFIYVKEAKNLKIDNYDFEQWNIDMMKVHLDKGAVAVAYFCAAVFRDIIYKQLHYFPHLNCFGPPGTGKSGIAWCLSAMFGVPKEPFHIVQGTNVGFYRRLAQFRNGVCWFDEYSNDVPHKRIEALKSAYDGVGHEKGIMSQDNRTTRTKVNSAAIITGQQQPTQDIALFTRCISLNFGQTKYTADAKTSYERLQEIGQTGICSQVTVEMLAYREKVEKGFYKAFDEARRDMMPELEGYNVKDRIVNNHMVTLALVKLLQDDVQFGFTYQELFGILRENIIRQNESIGSQDEISRFWDIFNFFIEDGLIKENNDFTVQLCPTLTVKIDGARRGDKDTRSINFPEAKKVLFLTLTKMHQLYLKHHITNYRKSGLDKGALIHYLKTSPGFIGTVKAKKIGGKTKVCYAFDVRHTHLGDMEVSISD